MVLPVIFMSKLCGSLRRHCVLKPANYLGRAPTAKHEDRRDSAQVCLFLTEHCSQLGVAMLGQGAEPTMLWCCRSDL